MERVTPEQLQVLPRLGLPVQCHGCLPREAWDGGTKNHASLCQVLRVELPELLEGPSRAHVTEGRRDCGHRQRTAREEEGSEGRRRRWCSD